EVYKRQGPAHATGHHTRPADRNHDDAATTTSRSGRFATPAQTRPRSSATSYRVQPTPTWHTRHHPAHDGDLDDVLPDDTYDCAPPVTVTTTVTATATAQE
ncbi:hypothetical protein, partial [Nonomuraea turkmeniaca]|uniref:hypothetical protein n=1 Tax=Nonomuraea turkmeniaca TaxID=103838 RepID=UPI00147763A8